jgi:hypothetical protein
LQHFVASGVCDLTSLEKTLSSGVFGKTSMLVSLTLEQGKVPAVVVPFKGWVRTLEAESRPRQQR